MDKPRVLVVGAGISGLALVRALTDRGLPVEVVERSADWQTSGAGLYLPANAVRALYRLGIGDEVAKRAERVVRQRLHDHRGRALAEFDVSGIWGDVGDCLAISRNDLHEVLRTATAGTDVRFNAEVSSVDAEGTVTFADGSTKSYDLIVGADGIHSAVRRSAFGGPEPRFLGQLCWRFLAEDSEIAGISDWTGRLGSGGRGFLTVQLGGGRVYCYADVNSPHPSAPDGDWRSLFADFAAPVPQLLEQGADAHFAALYESVGADWTRPHIVLIGDAAHACSPSMAQGGAMALEDALVLAELLGEEDDVTAALTAFQARRADRVQWVLDQNHRRDKARKLPTPLRNLTFRLVGERLFKANHAPLHTLP
jgi:2-polyprenyl-6-methoxyphenol hydroxylase-like FAD-dependent oxidoreductase